MLTLYKKQGETPLACLNRFKEAHPEYKDVRLSYAGRLDPMAEGLLLVLEGDENYEREKYLSLDKVYEVEVLLGVSTDTYDPLGIVQRVNDSRFSRETAEQILATYIGGTEQEYPPFASKTINGVPMHRLAREGKLEGMLLPTLQVTVHNIDILGYTEKSGKEIFDDVSARIGLVTGDFRQEEILDSWKKMEVEYANAVFQGMRIIVSCSSGTYMRSIAHKLGEQLGVGGIAYTIKRTKMGDISVKDVVV